MKKYFALLVLFVLVGYNCLLAQTLQVSGTVTSTEDGTPIPGVSVLVKGTTIGTATDIDGKYTLAIPQTSTVLVFTFVGMKTQEVVIDGRTIINVVMEFDTQELEEIVVVGYGTQIKSKLTGNIAKVDGEDLEYKPVPSIELALQGKAAGVFIESVTGKVTSSTRVRIRGASSLSASNEPLYVLDGVPLSLEARNLHGGDNNPLASLNFNDIESVEILKDASAAAIYGSRATNGVILITTKRGKTGDTRLNFNYQMGFSQPSNLREFLNAEEFIDYFRHAAERADLYRDQLQGNPAGTSVYWRDHSEGRFKRYSGWAVILEDPDDPNSRYLGSQVDTDWQKLAFRNNAGVINADLSASGGTDKLKYFASGGYTKQDGIAVANGFERISGRLNVDNEINKVIDIGLSMSLSHTDINQINADNAFANPIQLVALSPITPVRDLDGILYSEPTTSYYNGLRHVEYATRKMNEIRSVANGYLNFKLIEGFNWRNELGYDIYNLKENNRYGELTETGEGVGGYGFSNYAQTQNILGKSYFNFLRNFGDIGVSAVLGSEIQYTLLDNTWLEGQGFPMDELRTLASAGELIGGTQTITEYSFLSYFTRVNLDYKAKYLLSLSNRIDGSSRFGVNNRYGTFPSASAGWVISKEEFLADNKIISFLKIRTSYGLTGNAAIGNFSHLGLYTTNNYNSVAGLIPSRIPNPDLGWESTAQFDVGIDFGFLNNRFNGEIDFYMKETTDLLMDVPVPGTSGYSIQTRNVGSMENKGVEFVLNTNNLVGEFKWSTNFNIAYNKNKVTEIAGQTIIDPGSSRYMNVVILNEPLGVFYGAEYAGVDPDNGNALWYINQKDDDGNVIDSETTTSNFSEANFVILGNPNPPIIGAITNSFQFFGFDLSFTLQGITGNKTQLAGDSFMGANANWYDNQLRSQLNSWKEPGDITDIPEARLGYVNGNQARSSRYIEDGSYLKLRSLILGYEFPKSLTKKIGIERLRVYIIGQNLYTWTKFSGWDPEVSSDFVVGNIISGIDFYSPPQPRTITFGINMGL
jgi:TonB-linked SusC/RagA family outer membrane protein